MAFVFRLYMKVESTITERVTVLPTGKFNKTLTCLLDVMHSGPLRLVLFNDVSVIYKANVYH